MVFGFGEGKIELKVDKTACSFGEMINGELKLTLKKPKQARQLRVTLKAERKVSSYSGGKYKTRKDTIYSFDVVLAGENLYNPPGGEYKFSIQIPAKNAIPEKPDGALGTAITAVQFLGGVSSQIKWHLEGALDIPGSIDVKKSVQLTVS